jgi:predicted nuclease of restriction endonuclease-like (RecB) superfamily
MNKIISKEYSKLLNDLKKKVASSQTKAVLAVNKELVLLYWNIGKKILENQNNAGWGAKVIDLLSKDLSTSFPEMKGFSVRNLKYMRSFAEANPDYQIVQQGAAQLPWFHNCVLLDKIKDQDERLWYIKQTIKNGWSRKVLIHQVEQKLYKRQIKNEKTHNFKATLTPTQSDLAHQTLKDPYIFDFLSIGKEAQERDIENELTTHITNFLLELGAGFSYVGRQIHLKVGKQDYYIDLLFYHLKLRCYIVIELKMGEFRPEHAGKINFYLSAVDDLRRHPDDNSSIGIILCQSKEKIIVEYALRNLNRPIGVSQYKLVETLPDNLKANLPSIEEIEKELSKKPVKVKKKVTRSQKQ